MMVDRIPRRTLLKGLSLAAGGLVIPGVAKSQETIPPKKSSMGLVLYCCGIRRSHLKKQDPAFDLYQPLNFLKHCRDLGAGGAQLRLGPHDDSEKAREIRRFAEENDLYFEAIVSAPKKPQDKERFQSELSMAKFCGALAARTTVIPGRRYEFFSTREMFEEYDKLARKSAEMMAKFADDFRIPVAIENHKDHRDDERVALFKAISSEYVGACVDTGNSFALLEDPISTIEKLAPWAHSVHLKDQALRPYEDGFLLGDIPLGQGGLDLKRMVEILKKTRPNIRFTLELITRDPLKVPVLTDKYWATFPDLHASELARTMRYVRDHQTDNLQYISKMSPEGKLKQEDVNVRQSLNYARDSLGLNG